MDTPTIHVDDVGVQRDLGGGKVEAVTWACLTAVSVWTTSDGPFAEDVFFVLESGDGSGCIIPQSAPESTLLLERLQQLPGFDNAAFILAMQSTEDKRFTCWRRS
jgi:hypothetical protein